MVNPRGSLWLEWPWVQVSVMVVLVRAVMTKLAGDSGAVVVIII